MYEPKIIEIISGFIILIGVVILSYFFLNKLNDSGKLSKSCYNINAVFANVDGLKVGDEVKIFGVKIGYVESIDLNLPNYQPKLAMCINTKYSIPSDSSASIVSYNLLGKKYISISPGSEKVNIFEDGNIEYTQSEISLNSVITKVINSLLKQ